MEHPVQAIARIQSQLNALSLNGKRPWQANFVQDNVLKFDDINVCIYGSSLIRDLYYFASQNPMNKAGINAQLNVPGIHVEWCGVPGLRLARLRYESQPGVYFTQNGMLSFLEARIRQPDLAVCLWGGNDIDNGEAPLAILDFIWKTNQQAITLKSFVYIRRCRLKSRINSSLPLKVYYDALIFLYFCSD